MTSASVQQSFIANYLPLAQSVSSQTGLPVDYVLGQAAEETDWGQSNAAVNGNNFFGISPGGQLATYDSPASGFSAYGSLINSGYPGASSQTSALGFGSYLQSSGYATDPNYATSVAGDINQVDGLIGTSGASTSSGAGGIGYNYLTGEGDPYDTGLFGTGGTSPGGGTGTGSLLGGGSSGGGLFGSLFGSSVSDAITQVEELAFRAMLIVAGLVLISGGIFVLGTRSRTVQTVVKVAGKAAALAA